MSKTRKARAFLKLDTNRHLKGAAKAMFLGQPRAMVGSFSSSSSPSLSPLRKDLFSQEKKKKTPFSSLPLLRRRVKRRPPIPPPFVPPEKKQRRGNRFTPW